MAEIVSEDAISLLDDAIGGFERNYEVVLDTVKLLMKCGHGDKANEVLKILKEK